MSFRPFGGVFDTQDNLLIKQDVSGSAFGDPAFVEIQPKVQIEGLYGIRPSVHETFSATGGTTDTTGGKFRCQSGTSAGGYGVIRSRRQIHYQPGLGIIGRFTSTFTAGVATSFQAAGFLNAEDAVCFGYDGTSFGVLRRSAGTIEIRRLTITTPAGGAETATVTLNGTAYNISVSNGTAAHNAYEIAVDTSFTGSWDAFQNGSTITFIFLGTGAKSGTYSLTSTGVLAGTFSQIQAGVADTNSWVAQGSWNHDTFDGTGPSGYTLAPANLNLYQVDFGYLGAANICYRIYNPNTGRFELAHCIERAGSETTPILQNPTLRLGYSAASLGSTGTNLIVTGASMCAYQVGVVEPRELPHARIATAQVATGNWEEILTIRVQGEFTDRVNLREVIPQIARFAVDGTKPAEVGVFIWQDHEDHMKLGESNFAYQEEDDSCVEYVEETAVTFGAGSGERLIASAPVAKTGSVKIDLTAMNVTLERTEVLTLAARATSGSTDVTASLTWTED